MSSFGLGDIHGVGVTDYEQLINGCLLYGDDNRNSVSKSNYSSLDMDDMRMGRKRGNIRTSGSDLILS